jgi:aquaglyceroporin related protein, other eukaryote
MLGVYVAGDSGGYLNPAVTFANCIYRGLPWKRFPMYLVAQFLGGWIAALIVYGYYYYAIDNYEGVGIRTVPPSKTATAGIFCTYPQPFMTTNAQFWAEVIETTMLQFGILALKDMSNVGAEKFLPLGLFFLIFGLGACFGLETGYAMNFARDFGPRLASYMVGYGPKVWTAGKYYFWVPVVAPFIGCTFGGFLYDVFIYTGPSPINTPWMGLKRFMRPDKAREIDERYGAREVQA